MGAWGEGGTSTFDLFVRMGDAETPPPSGNSILAGETAAAHEAVPTKRMRSSPSFAPVDKIRDDIRPSWRVSPRDHMLLGNFDTPHLRTSGRAGTLTSVGSGAEGDFEEAGRRQAQRLVGAGGRAPRWIRW